MKRGEAGGKQCESRPASGVNCSEDLQKMGGAGGNLGRGGRILKKEVNYTGNGGGIKETLTQRLKTKSKKRGRTRL